MLCVEAVYANPFFSDEQELLINALRSRTNSDSGLEKELMAFVKNRGLFIVNTPDYAGNPYSDTVDIFLKTIQDYTLTPIPVRNY